MTGVIHPVDWTGDLVPDCVSKPGLAGWRVNDRSNNVKHLRGQRKKAQILNQHKYFLNVCYGKTKPFET